MLPFQPENIKAVIYDLDGTLIDTEPVAAQALEQALQTLSIEVSNADKRHFVGKSTGAIFDYLYRVKPIQQSRQDLLRLVAKHYLHLLRGPLPELPGARQSIHYFSQHYQLGLVSGSEKDVIVDFLTRLEVLDKFQVVLGIEDYLDSKPSPKGFLQCLKQLAVAPNHSVVIEDSYAGVQAAKAAGAWTIAVTAANHTAADLSAADASYPTLNHFVDCFKKV